MTSNIFSNIPNKVPEEIFEILASGSNVKIERIISDGHKSDKDFWYNQEQNEFVIVLQGYAEIEFENDETIPLTKGNYLNIPAHKKHRVNYTSLNEKTIWLAVYY